MKDFIIYELSTGKILRVGSCPDNMFYQQASEVTEWILEGIANTVTQYIDTVSEEILDKVELPASIDKTDMLADGIDKATISNLPNPTEISVDERLYTITDDIFELTIDTPGEYEIMCRSFPYLDKEFVVNAS